MSKETEWAWAAGVFEGEGCITSCYTDSGKKYRRAILKVAMTDLDTMQRLAELWGVKVVGPYQYAGRAIPIYVVQTTAKAKVEQIMAEFWPYLGGRRKSRATELGIGVDK